VSTPIVAGIVALLNAWRLANGKAVLGYVRLDEKGARDCDDGDS
jgi:hypothetical protein